MFIRVSIPPVKTLIRGELEACHYSDNSGLGYYKANNFHFGAKNQYSEVDFISNMRSILGSSIEGYQNSGLMLDIRKKDLIFTKSDDLDILTVEVKKILIMDVETGIYTHALRWPFQAKFQLLPDGHFQLQALTTNVNDIYLLFKGEKKSLDDLPKSALSLQEEKQIFEDCIEELGPDSIYTQQAKRLLAEVNAASWVEQGELIKALRKTNQLLQVMSGLGRQNTPQHQQDAVKEFCDYAASLKKQSRMKVIGGILLTIAALALLAVSVFGLVMTLGCIYSPGLFGLSAMGGMLGVMSPLAIQPFFSAGRNYSRMADAANEIGSLALRRD